MSKWNNNNKNNRSQSKTKEALTKKLDESDVARLPQQQQ
jgi:hypothetical protein